MAKKRGRFSFDEMEIEPGAELVFKNDENIKCTVKDEHNVTYQGQTISLSSLTVQVGKFANNMPPLPYWKYNGRLLTDIFNEVNPVVEDTAELDELHTDFLKRFPLEKLDSMDIDEYVIGLSNDNFSNLIEFKTRSLGCISGGTSAIHGIYAKKKKDCKVVGTIQDEKYAWYKKYGETAEEAFKNIRSIVSKIAHLANEGNFAEIDKIDFSRSLKLKIAFMYSNKNMMNIFQDKALNYLCRIHNIDQTLGFAEKSHALAETVDKANFWNSGLWREWEISEENTETENDNFASESKVHYWLYSPGTQADKWDEFREKGVMGISFEKIGNLSSYATRADMVSQMQTVSGRTGNFKMDSLAAWQFVHEMKEGDVIFAKKGRNTLIGRGVVTSNYYFDDKESDYPHLREVKWTHNEEHEHPDGMASMKTLTDITKDIGYVESLNAIFLDDEELSQEIEEADIAYEAYTKDDFLNQVYMSEKDLNTIDHLLASKKNIILQGAPGVGKTFAAKRLAYALMEKMDSSRVQMIQFHQSYSYEDFIMGYRPVENGFKLETGAFYDFCKKASEDEENNYYFIIDEINRGNLSKIFGELFMLIESDKRGQELRLLYKKEMFSVPKNVYIIGLMNTADRSLAMLDYALRRRFAFFNIKPGFDSEGFRDYQDELKFTKFDALIQRIKDLNQAIENDASLGKGFCIGHSYFCNLKPETISDEKLQEIVEYEMIPLLEEYWFDEPEKVKQWSNALLSVVR